MVKPTNLRESLFNHSPKDKIKGDILSQFKAENADVGHTLPPNWLVRYGMTLNPKEKAVFDEAVNELITEGIVEPTIRNNLAFTAKGVEYLY
jgi:hypothetical protein